MPTGVVYMDVDGFNEMPAPDDAAIGAVAYVRAIAGTSGFTAYARVNANGDNEWYVEADSFQVSVAVAATNTDAPAGDTYFTGLAAADLTDWTEVRVSLRVATAGTTADARLKYTTNNFTSDADLTSTANALDLSTTGVKASAWEPIPAGARGPVTFGLVSFNGDGSEDPSVVSVVAHFRR
jgi:hypothetical protein